MFHLFQKRVSKVLVNNSLTNALSVENLGIENR